MSEVKKENVSVVFEQQPKFDYQLTGSAKLIQQRRTVSYKSDRTEYKGGDTIILPFGSSTEWILGSNSYLKMHVKFASTGAATDIGIGNAVNIFESMALSAKSGIQIEYLRDLATLVNIRDTYSCSDAYLKSTGSAMGYTQLDTKTNAPSDGDHLNGGGFTVCVPLHHISGFLGTDRYIPMNVLGGLELQLKLNDGSFAFQDLGAGADGAANVVTVTNVELVCDAYRMVDPILKYSERLAKTKKMMMMFDTFSWNRSPIAANTATTLAYEKGYTKCLGAYSRVRLPAANAAAEGLRDSIASATDGDLKITSYQWRAGSEAFPMAPVKTNMQGYVESLKSFNNLANCVRVPSVNFQKYTTTHRIIGQNFERDVDSADFLSGLGTNNKNTISLELEVDAAANVTTWLHYVRILVVDAGELRLDQ